jgi:hypothetical protein
MAAAGTAADGLEPRLLRADDAAAPLKQPVPRADACILLWMAGGMAGGAFDPAFISRLKSACRSSA